jgi:hypothetical protein
VLGLHFTEPEVSRLRRSVAMDNFDLTPRVMEAVSTISSRKKTWADLSQIPLLAGLASKGKAHEER